MHTFVVVTVMPGLFDRFAELGVVGAAFKEGRARLVLIDPRDHATDRHRSVDDAPYGGGPGMVLKPEPLDAALGAARKVAPAAKVWHLSPGGERFSDARARELATASEHILLCGRYLGIDQRVLDIHVDHELSIGDYVSSGGGLPAMLVIDATLRHVAGVLGDAESAARESFAAGTLAPPCYTRPPEHAGRKVPSVLLGGDHAKIASWRAEKARERTAKWRDLNTKK